MRREIVLLSELNKSYKKLNLKYSKLFFAFFLMLISALLEMAGLSLLYPLMLFIGGSDMLSNNNYLQIFTGLDLQLILLDRMHLVFLFFCLIFIAKNLVLSISYRYNIYFSNYFFKNFTSKLFVSQLNRPIIKVSQDGVGHITNLICVETKNLIDGIIRPSLVLSTELIITIGISIVALCISPIVLSLVIFACMITISLYYAFLRNKAFSWGREELKAESQFSEITQNSLRGICEVKIFDWVNYLSNKVDKLLEVKTKMFYNLEMYQQNPRYILETVFIITIMLYCSYSVFNGMEVSLLVAKLSIILAAAFRILPGINRMVGSYSNISFHLSPAITLLSNLEFHENYNEADTRMRYLDSFSEIYEIEMINVNFGYESDTSKVDVISNLNLKIQSGNKIGLFGNSGSGKSTLLKILSCLYKPHSGKILVNGLDINTCQKSWQSNISYVPQESFVMAGTIAENITIGSEYQEEKLLQLIKTMGIIGIFSKFPKGIHTVLGPQGVNLSGGQKQLISLVRALYSNPKLLLLDEPTASLDSFNEDIVMNTINNLQSVTIVMVSHKLGNFKKFDRVYRVNNSVISEFDYEKDNTIFTSR